MTTNDTHEVRYGRIAATMPVSDIERTYRLYNKVFGFEKVFENGDPVGFMILRRHEAELHLTLQPNHKSPHFNVAHMLVSNIDAVHQLCVNAGLRVIKGLQNKDYGVRAFVFEDYDGNRIDVGQNI